MAKINASGEWEWATAAGDIDSNPAFSDEALAIVTNECGDSYVTGYIGGTSPFLFGELQTIEKTFGNLTVEVIDLYDVFIAKINKDGRWVWAQRAGGIAVNDQFTSFDSTQERGTGIDLDCHGNVYVTGSYFTEPFNDPESNADVINPHFGRFNLFSDTQGSDGFVAKLTPDGNWQWVRRLGSDDNNFNQDLSVDCYGNIYTIGTFNGDLSFFDEDGSVNVTQDNGTDDLHVAKISSTMNLNMGFLKENATEDDVVEVFFPGGVVSDPMFSNLLPGHTYYVGCNCRLTTCCKCAVQHVGFACDANRILTGVSNPCDAKDCCNSLAPGSYPYVLNGNYGSGGN